jgi:hypothetical protein
MDNLMGEKDLQPDEDFYGLLGCAETSTVSAPYVPNVNAPAFDFVLRKSRFQRNSGRRLGNAILTRRAP